MKYTERVIGRQTYKQQDFSSISEFNEYLAKAKPNRHFEYERLSSQSTDYSYVRFCGTDIYSEAEQLFATGWRVLAEKLTKKLPIQTTSALANRSKPTYGLVGSQASIPRYLQGVPTNMIDRKVVQQKQKIIVINRGIGFNAGVSKEQIEEEGLKALQIIQALENRGYRVKLNLYWLVQEDNETLTFRVCVKKPEERLSIIKLAFPIAHPSMLRRIAFRWLEVHPTMSNRGFIHGYGRPMESDIRKLVEKTEYVLPNFIYSVDEFIEGLKL